MNINALYRHPSELEAEAMLSREQAYPDDFTLADRGGQIMSNVLTIKPGNPDLFHAEATPDGVNIMTPTPCKRRRMIAISAIVFLVSAKWNHITVLILAQTEIMRLGAASALSVILIIVITLFNLVLKKATGLGKERIFGEPIA